MYCYSTVLCFTAKITLLLRLNDEFDGIWTSCGLRRRFRRGYGDFGFYDHSDIMTKMVWSQGGHNKRRLLYHQSETKMADNSEDELSDSSGNLSVVSDEDLMSLVVQKTV